VTFAGGQRIITALALSICLGGCATVTRGTTETVGFDSSPSGAEMRASNGLACTTPCSLVAKRNESFVAAFTKPGLIPQQVTVDTVIVGEGVAAAAGNAVVGGLVGLSVDAITRAGFNHWPNPVSVTLERDAPPAATVRTPEALNPRRPTRDRTQAPGAAF
jgi:hypothetical protein